MGLYFLIGLMPAVLVGLSTRYLTQPSDFVLKCNSDYSNSTSGSEFCLGNVCCRNECQKTYLYEQVPQLVTGCICLYKGTQFAAKAWLAFCRFEALQARTAEGKMLQSSW